MSTIERWLGQHPYVVIAIIGCLTLLLIVAMVLGLDLSWIPALLRAMVTR